MSGASEAQQRLAELVAAVSEIERLPTALQIMRVRELVSRQLAFSGALLGEVVELRETVRGLRRETHE